MRLLEKLNYALLKNVIAQTVEHMQVLRVVVLFFLTIEDDGNVNAVQKLWGVNNGSVNNRL